MKRYILIGAIGIIVTATLLYFFMGETKPSGAGTLPSTTLPTAGAATSTGINVGSSPNSQNTLVSFVTRNSVAVTVKDFMHNGETVEDVVNPGSYVLAGDLGYCLADGTCPSGNPTKNFIITYTEKTHFFTIVLLTEPLGEVRLEAEQFLINRLGLSPSTACYLDYSIGAPYWVNSLYAGKNLGFSFCPGAVVLPK